MNFGMQGLRFIISSISHVTFFTVTASAVHQTEKRRSYSFPFTGFEYIFPALSLIILLYLFLALYSLLDQRR